MLFYIMLNLRSKPFLLHGRRTGVNILKGKKIRKQEDGADVFDDYWTESEGSASLSGSPTKESKKTSKALHGENRSDISLNKSDVDDHLSERRRGILCSKPKDQNNSLTVEAKSTSPMLRHNSKEEDYNNSSTMSTKSTSLVVKSRKSKSVNKSISDAVLNKKSAQSHQKTQTSPYLNAVNIEQDHCTSDQLQHAEFNHLQDIDSGVRSFTSVILNQEQTGCLENDVPVLQNNKNLEMIQNCNPAVSSLPDVYGMCDGSQLSDSNSKVQKCVSFNSTPANEINNLTKNINNKESKNDQYMEKASHETVESSNSNSKEQQNVSISTLKTKKNESVKNRSAKQTVTNHDMVEDSHNNVNSNEFCEDEIGKEHPSNSAVNCPLSDKMPNSLTSKTVNFGKRFIELSSSHKKLCNETHVIHSPKSAFLENANARKNSFATEENVNNSENIASSKDSDFSKMPSTNKKSKSLASETHIIAVPSVPNDNGSDEEINSINAPRSLLKSKQSTSKSIQNSQTKENVNQHIQSKSSSSPYTKENSRKRSRTETANNSKKNKRCSSLKVNQNNLTNPKISSKKKKKTKVNVSPVTNCTRKSSRQRFPVLQWWRNQRPRYRITESGNLTFLGIDEGTKEDDTAMKILMREIQRKVNGNQKKGVKQKDESINEIVVEDVETGQQVLAELVKPFSSLTWKNAGKVNIGNSDYSITKYFDSNFISFGFLDILPHKEKSLQYLPDDDVHFTVLKGEIKVQIHNTKFLAEKLTSFIVPHGNAYSLTNISNTNALISFTVFKFAYMQEQK